MKKNVDEKVREGEIVKNTEITVIRRGVEERRKREKERERERGEREMCIEQS